MKNKIKAFIEQNPGCTHESIAEGIGVSFPVEPFAALELVNSKEIIQRGNEFYPGTFSNTDILKHRAANRSKPKLTGSQMAEVPSRMKPFFDGPEKSEKKPEPPDKRKVTKASVKKKAKKKKKGFFTK